MLASRLVPREGMEGMDIRSLMDDFRLERFLLQEEIDARIKKGEDLSLARELEDVVERRDNIRLVHF